MQQNKMKLIFDWRDNKNELAYWDKLLENFEEARIDPNPKEKKLLDEFDSMNEEQRKEKFEQLSLKFKESKDKLIEASSNSTNTNP